MRVEFIGLKVKRDWKWVTKVLPVRLCEDTKGIIAIDVETNAPIAVCVMDGWTYTSVQVHFAIMRKMVLRHGFLEEVADFVFNKCGKDLMIGLVPGNNELALKMDSHIGFTEAYRVKDGFDKGVDYCILELRKEDCRWLEQPTMAEVHHG